MGRNRKAQRKIKYSRSFWWTKTIKWKPSNTGQRFKNEPQDSLIGWSFDCSQETGRLRKNLIKVAKTEQQLTSETCSQGISYCRHMEVQRRGIRTVESNQSCHIWTTKETNCKKLQFNVCTMLIIEKRRNSLSSSFIKKLAFEVSTLNVLTSDARKTKLCVTNYKF